MFHSTICAIHWVSNRENTRPQKKTWNLFVHIGVGGDVLLVYTSTECIDAHPHPKATQGPQILEALFSEFRNSCPTTGWYFYYSFLSIAIKSFADICRCILNCFLPS
jgi:hypothetical protein